METEIESESIDMTTDDDAIISFSRVVDDAIHSRAPSNLGEKSPLHSFRSVVDSAIRSRTPSNLGASGVVASTSVMMRTVAARSSQVEVAVPATATRHVAARLFTLAELKAATNEFFLHNRIFDGVYRGRLADGREVAIQRKQPLRPSLGRIPEFFFLSRLNHRNLVGLVGYCEDRDERLWVYEYMKNGSLRDQLHGENGSSTVLNSSWKTRIKIALDAYHGIEYLHNCADPSIIHTNIKSANILLDATWTARVSDFERSFMNSEPDCEYENEMITGTYGYLAPEYMINGIFTTKGDVYGLGVVLLELLTGKKAIFTSAENGGFCSVVDFAVPAILARDLVKILDPKVGSPDVNEARALEFLAYTAICCVKLARKDRPTMVDIVLNLERALATCYGSPDAENFPSPLLEFSTSPLSVSLSFWNISIPEEESDSDEYDSFSIGTVSDSEYDILR